MMGARWHNDKQSAAGTVKKAAWWVSNWRMNPYYNLSPLCLAAASI
jgi:hypothetical protein